MSPSRDFDAARDELMRDVEPVTFTLGNETFTCRSVIPIGDIWAGGVKHPDRFTTDHPNGRVFLAMAEQLALWLPDTDRERFWAIFDDPASEVIGAQIMQAVQWLTEVYIGRPQSPSSASPSGLPTVTGPPSSSTPVEILGASAT